MISKLYSYILGVLDRSIAVIITFLSEIVFMYFGVHLIMGIILAMNGEALISHLTSSINNVDRSVIIYGLNFTVTLAVYCIIYSKDIFKRLVYIFIGKTDKEV